MPSSPTIPRLVTICSAAFLVVGSLSPLAAATKSKITETLTQSGALVRTGTATTADISDDGKAVTLNKGVMVASSKSGGFNRQAVTVDTDQVSMKTQGTALIAYQPEKFLKITCVEGTVTVRLRALLGEFIKLLPGQMLIINPADGTLPDPVEIDLEKLIQTSALLGDLPTIGNIQAAADIQADAIAAGDTLETPLELPGAGPKVLVVPEHSAEILRDNPAPPTPENPKPPPIKEESGGGGGGGTPPPLPFILNTSTIFDPNLVTTPGSGTLAAFYEPFTTTFARFPPAEGTWEAIAPGNMLAIEQPDMGSLNIPGVYTYILGSDREFRIEGFLSGPVEATLQLFGHPLIIQGQGSGTAVVSVPGGGSLELFGDNIFIENAELLDTSSVRMNATGDLTLNRTEVDSSYINVGDPDTQQGPASINIGNSSDLQAFAINLISNGPTNIQNSSLSTSVGNGSSININSGGILTITNATLSADNINARTRNGADIFINGSTFNAGELIRIYAGNGGNLNFSGTVDLNVASTGGTIELAGRRVSVANGGNVNINGGYINTVFADQHDYNSFNEPVVPDRGNINGYFSRTNYTPVP